MPVIAFRDVTVVPMDGDRLLPHHTVIVSGDRIDRVSPTGDTVVPPDAVVVDGPGRYLMPGLVDMHVHYFRRRYGVLFVANGVTTVRNMFGTPMHLEMRAAAATAVQPGPSIFTTGPLMDGNPPAWADPAVAVIETPEQAEASVASQKRDGYDFLKTYSRLSRLAFDAIAAAAKRHSIRVVGHLPAAVPLDHAVKNGLESVEHIPSLLQALQADDSPFLRSAAPIPPAQMYAHVDLAKISEIASLMRSSSAWSCPTMVVSEKMSLAGSFEEQLRREDMRFLPAGVTEYWRGLISQYNMASDVLSLLQRTRDVQREIVRGLHTVGARLLLGTDSNMPLVAWGFAIHDELRLLVEADLTPYEAIRAGTSDAAEFLHATEEFGRVAAGLRADLILIEGDPFADVANVRRRVGVMLRGRWLPETELRRMLEENAAASDANTAVSIPRSGVVDTRRSEAEDP